MTDTAAPTHADWLARARAIHPDLHALDGCTRRETTWMDLA
jgi:hypothetical protein